MKNSYLVTIGILILSFYSIKAQTVVNSLAGFRSAVQNSDQEIVLEAGTYELDDLPSNSRVIDCSGSNNTIDMTGARIKALVGSIRETYFTVSGDNNVFLNGAIEDYYKNGQSDDITNYSAYNNNDDLAYGLRGAAVVTVFGNNNTVNGLELIVRGSNPYGYGSIYGIGKFHTFSLDKRCGLLITGRNGGGVGNTLDGVTMYQNAFGHGIFMQDEADKTLIKNCYVEGRMRLSAELYNETNSFDLPFRSNYEISTGEDATEYEMPFKFPMAIPMDVMYPLSEDGIRSYGGTGSVTVENCTVKQMRGGIRLYLASSATVTNSQAIDCGAANYNMPNNGKITGSSGNFSFAPLNDHRLSRSRQDIEMTIIPSPNATGPHNLADILGNDHDIVFHRTPGPLDSDEQRAIVVSGDNSTIVNETEYTIILNSGANGNTITSCGPVIDNGSNNTVTLTTGCENVGTCNNTTAKIEAECYDDMFGVTTEASSEGTDNIGNVHNGDWVRYNNIDLSDIYSVNARVATVKNDVSVEVRLDALEGELLAIIPVTNTGDWQTWTTNQENIGVVDGIHDVYFIFTGGGGGLLNANWFGFSEDIVCKNTASHIEAECYDDMSGIQTQGALEGTLNVGWVNNGDWASYENIDLSGMNSIKTRVSSKISGSIIEVRLDAIDGDLIAEVPVTNTGGNQDWVTDSVNIASTDGVHDIYLVFTGGESFLFNINDFGFSEEKNVVTSIYNLGNTSQLEIKPNPVANEFRVLGKTGASLELYTTTGHLLIEEQIISNDDQFDVSHLQKGIYVVRVIDGEQINVSKIVKE